MSDEAPWHPHQQQIVALTTLAGVLIGALRAAGSLPPEVAEQVFALADSLLPAEATPQGTTVLAAIRATAGRISPD